MASKRIPGSSKKPLTSQPAPASPTKVSPPSDVKVDNEEETALKIQLEQLKIAIKEKEKQRAGLANKGSSTALEQLHETTTADVVASTAKLAAVRKEVELHKEKAASEQAKLRTLQAEVADLRKDLASSAIAATQALASLPRPEIWTAEGKTLSRLERAIAGNETALETARSKRDILVKDLQDLKLVHAEKQSMHAKGQADINTAEDKLVALLQKADAAGDVDERVQNEKAAALKIAEKDVTTKKSSLETAEREIVAITARLEQFRRHPNASATPTPSLEIQTRKTELKAAYDKAQVNFAERTAYRVTLQRDLEEARKANSIGIEERAKIISNARAQHGKRQAQALAVIREIVSGAPGGYEVPIEETQLTVLADTIAGESLLKFDSASLAVLLEAAKACKDVPELHQQSVIDKVDHEASKTRALQIKLQSLQAKAEHDGRGTPAKMMSVSGRSDASGIPGQRLAELEAKFTRIDHIATLLAGRHQELVKTLGEVQAQSAQMELAWL